MKGRDLGFIVYKRRDMFHSRSVDFFWYEGDSIRVKSKQIDDLQLVMRTIRGMEWEAPLVFENMR